MYIFLYWRRKLMSRMLKYSQFSRVFFIFCHDQRSAFPFLKFGTFRGCVLPKNSFIFFSYTINFPTAEFHKFHMFVTEKKILRSRKILSRRLYENMVCSPLHRLNKICIILYHVQKKVIIKYVIHYHHSLFFIWGK